MTATTTTPKAGDETKIAKKEILDAIEEILDYYWPLSLVSQRTEEEERIYQLMRTVNEWIGGGEMGA